MRRVRWTPGSAAYAWLFDILFASPPTVTWAPAGQLPAGFRLVEQFTVLPGGGGRAFMVSVASRRGSSAALTSYNALRPPRRRFGRVILGSALRLWPGNPLAASKVDIGVAEGASQAQVSAALLSEHLAELLGRRPVVIAFGAGTGPYRKPVLQVFGTDGTPLGYVKIGWNDWTRAAVRREAEALRACADRPIRLGVPDLLHDGQWHGLDLMVTAPLPKTARRPGNTLPGTDVLREICELSPRCVTELAASSWWADLRSRISGVADQDSATRLAAIADGLDSSAGKVQFEFGRWHGDLVPWNLARVGSRLFAWDWESSAGDAPLGFDALHFHFQIAFVAERRPLAEAVPLAARNAGPALAELGMTGQTAGHLAALHLAELALRHEEARGGAGEADDRFFPAVLDLLEQQAGVAQSAAAGRPVADQAA